MKHIQILSVAVAFGLCAVTGANAVENQKGHPILSPLEPISIAGKYNQLLAYEDQFQKNTGFDMKTYQLISLAAAAGMKCEYCILYHTAVAKKAGASDEEIKSVAMMSGLIAINSTMLYANQFDIELLRKAISQ